MTEEGATRFHCEREEIRNQQEEETSQRTEVLTIAIPTYNRASKLGRLLDVLEKQLGNSGLTSSVPVLVANNASPDNTKDILKAAAESKQLRLEYFTNATNVGFDNNILALYNRVKTAYVWFIGDDDLPLEGAIETVVNTLRNERPDMLLMPIIQPPGSWRPEYEFPEPYRITSNPALAADTVMQIGKVSVYVMRVIDLTGGSLSEVLEYVGIGYLFQTIAFAVLQSAETPKLLQLSKPMVTSDDDFRRIPWTPAPILEGYRISGHSFARRWAPNLLAEKRRACYRAVVRFLWDGQTGTLCAEDQGVWDDFADRLEWRWPDLWRSPLLFTRFLLIKLHWGYAFRRGFLKMLRSCVGIIGAYCRKASWLTGARCRFRITRDTLRHRRVLTPRQQDPGGQL